MLIGWMLAAAAGATTPVQTPAAADYLADARALDALIAANYAYLDRFAGGSAIPSPVLAAVRDAVHDQPSLLHYAEDRLASLADHHAATGRSFANSWALVPTYADLWVVTDAGGFRIDSVRDDSPAARAGIRAGDRLVAVGDQPTAAAVAAFWAPIGRPAVADADAYAARVLAAGRRDRPRVLTVERAGVSRQVTLASLYADPARNRPPLDCRHKGRRTTVKFANSLGDQGTIAAFDACMAGAARDAVLIDLTDTPSGGNTSVARAIMGWFVSRPMPYQVHNLPAEERETGIGRQWVEQVLPRQGKHYAGRVTVRVGRWTGSMGEGLGVGLRAVGGRLCGTAMAGLRGAVYDFTLPASGLSFKMPAERLSTIDGTPRETVVPPPCR